MLAHCLTKGRATRQVGQHGEHSIVLGHAYGRKHCDNSQEQKMESTAAGTIAISRFSDEHVSVSSVIGPNFSNFFCDREQGLSSSDSFVLPIFFVFLVCESDAERLRVRHPC